MEEKESQAGKKINTGLILFIPLAIVIIAIFILMRWETQLVYEDEPVTEESIFAPNFTLQGLDGKSVSLDDYKGKVVLLNIWATWCPPCIAEAPSLEELNNRFKDDDFKLLTVSIDEDGENVIIPFMEKNKLSFPVLVDPEGSIMELYGAIGVPESFIIRKDGIVDGKIEGAIDWMSQEVIDYIDDLIHE